MRVRPLILDASALAAILFGEPKAASMVKKIAGQTLAAPTLLPYEMAAVCQKKKRKDPERALLYEGGLQRLVDLPLELTEVTPMAAINFSELFDLSAYDAAYLWLTVQLGGRLLTLDERLGKAAARLGVQA